MLSCDSITCQCHSSRFNDHLGHVRPVLCLLRPIIGIIDILDQLDGVLNGVSFVAANLDSLPKFGPKVLNLAAVVDRQVRADSAIKDLSTTIQQLAATHAGSTSPDLYAHCAIQAATADIQQKLDSFTTSVFARLDHLSAVCTSSLSNSTSQQDISDSHSTVR